MMEVTLAPRRAALALAGVALLLAALGTVGYLGQYVAGRDTAPGRLLGLLRQLFRLNAEGNTSSWYATALLLACAALLALVAVGTAASRGPFARHWWALAAIFAFLSLDEAISIHENFGRWTRAVIDTRGVFVYAWVVPYGAVALAVAITYLRFLAYLPRPIAYRFVLAGALYVGGAIGFETLQGHLAVFRGEGRLALAALAASVAVEEIMEMLGAVLFIYGLLAYLATQRAVVRFGAFACRPVRGDANVLFDHVGQRRERATIGVIATPVAAPLTPALENHPAGGNMDLLIDPRRAALRLAGVALLMAAAGTVGYLGQYVAGTGILLGRFFEALRQLFRLNAEGNISSWYATALLLGCALLLACIAGGTAAARMPFTRHWWVLAAIFVFLSLDEAISIHESFDGWAHAALGTRGLLLYAWVVPYALFALAVALAYLRLLLSLPRTIRLIFMLAGAIYVGGAVGFEPIQGYITTIQGRQGGAAHAASVAVEEVLEMLGAVLFIYGLLTYLAAQRCGVHFREAPRLALGAASATGSAGHRDDTPYAGPTAQKLGA